MTRSEATKLVAVTVASCAQAGRMSPAQIESMVDAWSMLLGDLPYDAANAALRVVLQRSQFVPSVAEVRAAALELSRGPVRVGGEAWGDVVRAMAREGAWKSPGVDFTFRDALVARLVDSFGWRELCLSENVVADRARFIDAYDRLAKEHRVEQQVPSLAAAREKREALGAGDAIARVMRALPGVDREG